MCQMQMVWIHFKSKLYLHKLVSLSQEQALLLRMLMTNLQVLYVDSVILLYTYAQIKSYFMTEVIAGIRIVKRRTMRQFRTSVVLIL